MSGLPRVKVEVAFASAPFAATPTYDDITRYVDFGAGLDIVRGRSFELDSFQAGTLRLRLDNTGREFEPGNTFSPYSPNVLPGKRIRVTAAWNLLTAQQADIETASTTGFTAGNGNSALGTSTAQAKVGTRSLTVTNSSGGAALISFRTLTGLSAVPAQPGEILTAMAHVLTPSAATTATVGFTWYDAAGTAIDTISGAAVATSTTVWTTLTHTLACPAGTAFATVLVRFVTTASGAVVHADGIGLFPTDTAPPVWSAGGPWPLYSGYIEEMAANYSAGDWRWLDVSCVDGSMFLAGFDLAQGGPYKGSVLADAPSSYWRMGETIPAGTIALLVGNNLGTSGATGRYIGVNVGCTPAQPGLIQDVDLCCRFESTTYLDTTDAALPANFTIEAWIRPVEIAGVPVIFAQELNSGLYAYTFGVDVAGHLTYTGGNPQISFTSTGVINPAGETTHVAITRNGNTHRMYIDGVLDTANVTATGTVGGAVARTTWFGTPSTVSDLYGDEAALYATQLLTGRILAHYQAGTAPFASALSGAAVAAVLDAAGWPAADRVIDVGASTIADPTSTVTGSALARLQAIEGTESGAFYITPAGNARFRGRHDVLTDTESTVTQIALSSAGPIDLLPPSIDFGMKQVRNGAAISREGGATVLARDTTSEAAYGARGYSRTLLTTNDDESADLGAWIVDRFKTPAVRVDEIDVDPAGSDQAWAGNGTVANSLGVLNVDIGYRATVDYQADTTGPTISTIALIEGVAHQIGHARWRTTFRLSPADTRAYWILDTSTLDGGTQPARCAY